MDHAEAMELGIDIKDIAALETKGVDIPAFRRIVSSLISSQQTQSERFLREEYDRKLKEMNSSIQKLLTLSQPVAELT
jgi:transcriptional regulator of NAD metabolism